jgi:FkbM family methyltransferase
MLRDPLKTLVRTCIVDGLIALIGRRNIMRIGRLLHNEARFDSINEFWRNGEGLLQERLSQISFKHEGVLVFDVGANVGAWSKLFSEYAKRAKYPPQFYAFEPCNSTFETLKKNIETWGLAKDIVPVRLAFSSVPGERTLYTVGENQGRNGLYEPVGERSTQEIIQCDTIDNWCKGRRISSIFFVKVDAEGHDLQVIQGADQMFSQKRIAFLQFEYNSRWIEARNFLRDTFEYFIPRGYGIGKVTRKGIQFYPGWDAELETFQEGNYLAVNSEYRGLLRSVNWTRYR